MKCVEVEKKLDLMFDGEVDLFEEQAVQQHFGYCNSCHKSYRSLQKLQNVSKNLGIALPTATFDNRILQAFSNHHQSQKQNSFWKRFLLPIPVFATITILFLSGLIGAFWLGRISAPSKVVTETVTVEKIVPQIIEQKGIDQPTKIETVVKYVKVPVFKEKEVVKIVNIENPSWKTQNLPKRKKDLLDFSKTTNALVTKVNLEAFQPTSDLNIRIIKKGDINE
jgi:hypothetical protein